MLFDIMLFDIMLFDIMLFDIMLFDIMLLDIMSFDICCLTLCHLALCHSSLCCWILCCLTLLHSTFCRNLMRTKSGKGRGFKSASIRQPFALSGNTICIHFKRISRKPDASRECRKSFTAKRTRRVGFGCWVVIRNRSYDHVLWFWIMSPRVMSY
jgi:hypothetical protein